VGTDEALELLEVIELDELAVELAVELDELTVELAVELDGFDGNYKTFKVNNRKTFWSLFSINNNRATRS